MISGGLLNRLYKRLSKRIASFSFTVMVHAHPLRYLFLELTRKCNLSCVYCGSDCSPGWDREELAVDRWIDVVRQIASDFDTSKIMVGVTGGEPMIKEGVLDLFRELNRLGFPFGVVTNGTGITKETVRSFLDTGITSISLSLDAPPEINDRLRGKGAARRVENAVNALLDAGYDHRLEIMSTVTRPVVDHLEATRRYVASLRVPMWRLVPIMSLGRAAAMPELLLDGRDFRTILEFVRCGRADALRPCPEFGDESYLGPRYEGEVRRGLFQCRAGITIAGIHFDGRIGACPELGDGFVQGNVTTDRFKDVWENRYQVFRDRSWTRKGICGSCDAYSACRGGSFHLYENPDAPLQRCIYDMMLRPEP